LEQAEQVAQEEIRLVLVLLALQAELLALALFYLLLGVVEVVAVLLHNV
jgi:hypothetical protein